METEKFNDIFKQVLDLTCEMSVPEMTALVDRLLSSDPKYAPVIVYILADVCNQIDASKAIVTKDARLSFVASKGKSLHLKKESDD